MRQYEPLAQTLSKRLIADFDHTVRCNRVRRELSMFREPRFLSKDPGSKNAFIRFDRIAENDFR